VHQPFSAAAECVVVVVEATVEKVPPADRSSAPDELPSTVDVSLLKASDRSSSSETKRVVVAVGIALVALTARE